MFGGNLPSPDFARVAIERYGCILTFPIHRSGAGWLRKIQAFDLIEVMAVDGCEKSIQFCRSCGSREIWGTGYGKHVDQAINSNATFPPITAIQKLRSVLASAWIFEALVFHGSFHFHSLSIMRPTPRVSHTLIKVDGPIAQQCMGTRTMLAPHLIGMTERIVRCMDEDLRVIVCIWTAMHSDQATGAIVLGQPVPFVQTRWSDRSSVPHRPTFLLLRIELVFAQ